jgi:hypothetical protein
MATATATPTTTAVATNTAKEVEIQRLGEWVAPRGRMAGRSGFPRIYQNAVFFMADFVGACLYKKGIPTVCYCEVIKPAILFRDSKKDYLSVFREYTTMICYCRY